jgi:hypothetical protein
MMAARVFHGTTWAAADSTKRLCTCVRGKADARFDRAGRARGSAVNFDELDEVAPRHAERRSIASERSHRQADRPTVYGPRREERSPAVFSRFQGYAYAARFAHPAVTDRHGDEHPTGGGGMSLGQATRIENGSKWVS